MLDSLITSKTRQKLLVKFFSNPKNMGHLRGLAEEFGESTNSIRKELNNLCEAGLLLKSEEKNRVDYQANPNHALFTNLQDLIQKYLGLDKLIHAVLERMADAARRAGRDPAELTLVAVSKTRPAADLQALIGCGQRHFGENYVQEALAKLDDLQDLRGQLVWHFIGPLQSNKSRLVAEAFDWVHSVDSLKLARRLAEQRPASLPPLQVCLQVNISGEASKSGVAPDELPRLADAVRELPRLQLRGLMSIPAPSDTGAHTRLAALLQPGMDALSMGMSNDLEAAIAAGATYVRIGTAVFGARA